MFTVVNLMEQQFPGVYGTPMMLHGGGSVSAVHVALLAWQIKLHPVGTPSCALAFDGTM